MLNGTLCATERALCCIVENYQTSEVGPYPFLPQPWPHALLQGLVVPEPLRPYMQGREFLPFVKELPKSLQKKQA
jgi:seryl-tRNA synthetase